MAIIVAQQNRVAPESQLFIASVRKDGVEPPPNRGKVVDGEDHPVSRIVLDRAGARCGLRGRRLVCEQFDMWCGSLGWPQADDVDHRLANPIQQRLFRPVICPQRGFGES